MAKFYIANAIPYVNAKPHIGHALEFVQSDVIKRFNKILGKEVLLLCGGDENALKNVQAAEQENTPIQEFVDKNSQLFFDLAKNLNVEFDVFQKGSDEKHHKSSQELWKRCSDNDDIYKKIYTGLYCVGCEQFYDKRELDKNGECFEHPGKKLEEVSEENYFFKLSKYQKNIEKLLGENQIIITPESRKNEALSFVKQGLKDISISRSNERAKNWGVDVPGDPTQKMYVWFDALNIYQSGIGFGWDETMYKKWWPADVHVIGKGILRFHAVYWLAFLLSAKLELPKAIFVHGYFTVNGQKMSKTLGNVIDPLDIIEKYGTDALRYYLLKEIQSTSDGDFSEERLKTVYNADLANGLGNLVARVAKLCEINEHIHKPSKSQRLKKHIFDSLNKFNFDKALAYIWRSDVKWGIRWIDKDVNETQPWQIQDKKLLNLKLHLYVENILDIAFNLKPFLPETAEKIDQQFKGPTIKSQLPLFPRI